MDLYNGRPDSTEGRLPREIRTYDFLDSLGIEYKRTDHEPANNMEACNEIDAVNDKDHVVQLLIDEDVLKGEDLVCHPCVCTSSLKMKTADVKEAVLKK